MRLTRDSFIRVKSKDREAFVILEEKVLHLQKSFYGICDSGDYCGLKIEDPVIDVLEMTRTGSDQTLFTEM